MLALTIENHTASLVEVSDKDMYDKMCDLVDTCQFYRSSFIIHENGCNYQQFSYVLLVPYTEICRLCDLGLFPLEARGITFDVTDPDNPTVAALPLPKIFNVHENELSQRIGQGGVATTKFDGSLIIAFNTPTGIVIKSKGAFTNEYSAAARRIFNDLYLHRTVLEYGWTYCFELVSPTNQIVLHYTKEDLVPICRRSNNTGNIELFLPEQELPDDNLIANMKDAEGWVIYTPELFNIVAVKKKRRGMWLYIR